MRPYPDVPYHLRVTDSWLHKEKDPANETQILNREQLSEIKRLLAKGYKHSQIANYIGVSCGVIKKAVDKTLFDKPTEVDKMLTLPVKNKWFAIIVSGEKKEEYYEMKPYWTKQFINLGFISDSDGILTGLTAKVLLKNGYQLNALIVVLTVSLDIGIGRKEWGAPDYPVYILKIIEVKNGR